MFQIEKQIADWRSRFLANESVGSREAEELESHLRDTFEGLQQSSITDEEAFWLAARRVGSPESVALEFAKINGAATWMRRAQWMLTGYLVIAMMLSVQSIFSRCLAAVAVYMDWPLWTAFVAAGCGVAFVVVFVVAAAQSLASGGTLGLEATAFRFSQFSRNRNRSVLVSALCLIGITVLICGVPMIGSMFGTIVMSRVMQVHEWGQLSLIVSLAAPVGRLLIVSTLLLTLYWLVRRDAEPGRSRWLGAVPLAMLACAILVTFGLLSLGVEPLYGADWAQ